jgi:putative aminopeptidase FrvX
MYELVKTLCEIPGPIGHEDRVQDWLTDHWGGFAKEVRRTRVANVLAHIGGSGPILAIMGHADEICFMVKSISDDGFLHIWPYYGDTRGYPPRWVMPLNQQATIVTNSGLVDGIFATASGHVVGGRDNSSFRYEWNDWFIDVGASSRAEAEALGIHPGARAIWSSPVRRFGATHLTGKAMDDRAALAIATRAGERLAGRDDLVYDIWLVSTIQEEGGLIGAQSVIDELAVDLCINLDVGLVGDIPGPDKRDYPCKLGGGPTLVYQDMTAHYSRRFTESLVNTAKANGIPVQQAIYQNYGSDGAPIIRRGAQAALLTYPTRYTHSPIETVDENDLNHCVDLIVAFATSRRESDN